MIINMISKVTSRFTSKNKNVILKKFNATNSTVPFQVYLSSVDFAANTMPGAKDTKVTTPQYLT